MIYLLLDNLSLHQLEQCFLMLHKRMDYKKLE